MIRRALRAAIPAAALIAALFGVAAAPATAAPAPAVATVAQAPARPMSSQTFYAYCTFSDGAQAKIQDTFFSDGWFSQSIYRTTDRGGDMEVVYNHLDGWKHGPGGLPVYWQTSWDGGSNVIMIYDILGATCTKRLP